MYPEHTPIEEALYFILYGMTGMAALIACAYLLLRRGNAFAAGITPPLRLRRWAASFFAAIVASHLWWMIFYSTSGEFLSPAHIISSVLDCITLITTISGTLLSLLQDRRRPVWPIVAATMGFAALGGVLIFRPSLLIMRIAIIYILLVYAVFSVYMMLAVRQYWRWLCDNYADLEEKRVWLSPVLIIGIMLLFIVYAFDDGDMAIGFTLATGELALCALLLWRVETLPALTPAAQTEQNEHAGQEEPAELEQPNGQTTVVIPTIDFTNIEQLLQEHCVDTRLYQQHDLKLLQLSKAIGINRSYLSMYFSSKGTSYNTYINDLRIRHFVDRCHETAASDQPVVVRQLARESGYHSYSTFSLAFKQRMGLSVTAWIRQTFQQ